MTSYHYQVMCETQRCYFHFKPAHFYLCVHHYWSVVSCCVVIRVAGIRQAVSWVKESWRKGEELYWNSWTRLDVHTLQPFYCICTLLQTCIPPGAHLTARVIPSWTNWESAFRWYWWECATLSEHTYLVNNLISGRVDKLFTSGCPFYWFC